jgi:hypothetical protein
VFRTNSLSSCDSWLCLPLGCNTLNNAWVNWGFGFFCSCLFFYPRNQDSPNCYHWCTYSGQICARWHYCLWTLSIELHDTLLAPRILRWRRVLFFSVLCGLHTVLTAVRTCSTYSMYVHAVLDIRQGRLVYLLCRPSRPALGSTKPPIRWPPGALFPAVRRPERVADHWPPRSAKVNNEWSYTSSPHVPLWSSHGIHFHLP